MINTAKMRISSISTKTVSLNHLRWSPRYLTKYVLRTSNFEDSFLRLNIFFFKPHLCQISSKSMIHNSVSSVVRLSSGFRCTLMVLRRLANVKWSDAEQWKLKATRTHASRVPRRFRRGGHVESANSNCDICVSRGLVSLV